MDEVKEAKDFIKSVMNKYQCWMMITTKFDSGKMFYGSHFMDAKGNTRLPILQAEYATREELILATAEAVLMLEKGFRLTILGSLLRGEDND